MAFGKVLLALNVVSLTYFMTIWYCPCEILRIDLKYKVLELICSTALYY